MSHDFWLKNTARLLGGALILGSASLAMGGTAAAAPFKGPNGDNGTVKVHDSATDAEDPRNEPKVCEFYLVGSNFDEAQEVSWRIKSWPPTGTKEVVDEGSLTLDGEGHGRTGDLGLPDGHYKVFWEFEGQNGNGGKHKVFWVDCGEEETPGGEEEPGGDEPGEEEPPGDGEENPGGEEPGDGEENPGDEEPPADGEESDGEETPGAEEPPAEGDEPGEETPGGGDEGSETPEADEAPAPADEGDAAGGLPVTGAALTGLVSAGLVAIGGGGAAVYFARRKKTAPTGGSEE
ncbi:hypothetical protein HDA32_005477 [Spinactinospora alkalitolerans]|uniref:Gram-positive cocci surface proteins LPxTG domain-containing protein n=1 Tax=Spinactinospora alkalitolerans TaxID=687207 RepID=A0A852U431_9ACTN|nr:hypothetical protein [Spinactinospora alkalitolerans]NYE50357.1 hypothetical protein [Spinactinospora alkalitolerans]